MTDWAQWFRCQLEASSEAFEWAFCQIPERLLDSLPPEAQYLGTWQPVRHLWHVTGYDRCLALPTMQQWLGAPIPPPDSFVDDDNAWTAAGHSPSALIAAFRQERQQQIELLDALSTLDWIAPRATLFGEKPLSWVVTKTFQHTYEHGDTLLRMGLWWEHILVEMAKYKDGGW